MPATIEAGLWGLLAGSSLVIGALIGWFAPLSRRIVAGIMAFGAGVLISALSFELIDDAWRAEGLAPVAIGLLAGALLFTGANHVLGLWGARHRKRAAVDKREEDLSRNRDNSGALALGALLDGIPESIVIGLGLLRGGAVGWVTVAAVFLSNLPEGLSSAAGMRGEGRSMRYTFGLWVGIALCSGVAAAAGYALFGDASPALIAGVQAVAAGAILAMIADTMIPEAFEGTHDFAGLITVLGFLTAFALSKLGG
ncbi:MAG: ZIP family zinc transporter [Sphingomonadaceae bacterium]|nr:ZIP family zinc transporter [Sphingomonadaceae bacterium]